MITNSIVIMKINHQALNDEVNNLDASRGLRRIRLLTDSEDDSEESNENGGNVRGTKNLIMMKAPICKCHSG